EHGRQADEPEHVERRRGANEPSGVEAGEKYHDDQADREPDELSNDDAAPRPPHVEARERHRADHNQPERGHQKQPVDVLQQAPVDPKHYPSIPTAAIFSKKIAFKILRAIGAATWPPLPPRSTITTTTTSGAFAGANAANHAWSWPFSGFDLAIICAVPVFPAMSRPGIRAAAPVPLSFTTAHRLWRRNPHTTGESSTWPATCPCSPHTTRR